MGAPDSISHYAHGMIESTSGRDPTAFVMPLGMGSAWAALEEQRSLTPLPFPASLPGRINASDAIKQQQQRRAQRLPLQAALTTERPGSASQR